MNHTYRGKTLKAGFSKYPISQDNGSQTYITSAAIYLRSEKTSQWSWGGWIMVSTAKKKLLGVVNVDEKVACLH